MLIEDIGVLAPTIFASVPRLFNRIYDKIIQGALHSGSAIKAALFTRALNSKLYHLENSGSLTHSIWDPLVFNKVKKVLGGRVRYMITASAPISSNVLSFLRVATGSQVCEAYGQTESCGGLTISWPNDFKQGHVGYVVPKYDSAIFLIIF
jgi:long-chain acyl-CoA synthetase